MELKVEEERNDRRKKKKKNEKERGFRPFYNIYFPRETVSQSRQNSLLLLFVLCLGRSALFPTEAVGRLKLFNFIVL